MLEDALRSADEHRGFHGAGAPTGTITDFWRWAYSDLMSNTTRGVFAEWMVARLLGLSTPQRFEWDACDLVTPEGVRIEVKCGAYRQRWHTHHPSSRIVFSGLRARTWSADTGIFTSKRSFNADLYVFCVQTETDMARWDAFDLDQWRFYLLRRDEVMKLNQDSVGLVTLRRLAEEREAIVLRARINREIVNIKYKSGKQ
ncbi:hypothetical protein J2848_000350 [Azospirillum lipoferum]|uniref:Uncharacterized protein n=1 Tax=Azospirillum lipoferum TaxID=193 RepID=A0A5A9GSA0_AZOLI|nr:MULTISPECIES: hypothetical protein [Azospirillum]KAA0597206.1 hypothetical protein FZ942_08925 [Azospirillum lipoferum]MCP1608714.1 hypothetical protein [Azospirillum lipoferum]MDW5535968.1 hypothetical protein [Azospirillum sp. NL1]